MAYKGKRTLSTTLHLQSCLFGFEQRYSHNSSKLLKPSLRRPWPSELTVPSSEIPQLIFHSNPKRNAVVFIKRCAPNANGNRGCSLSPLPTPRREQHLHRRGDAQRDGAWRAGVCSSSRDAQPGLLDMMLE